MTEKDTRTTIKLNTTMQTIVDSIIQTDALADGATAAVETALRYWWNSHNQQEDMMSDDKKANVHHVKTASDGTKIYGVGIWSENNAQYTAPLDAEARRLTGCYAECSRQPIGRMALDQARDEARKLWGYSKESE